VTELLDIQLQEIEGPQGEICRQILDEHRELFKTVPGSSNNHQAWPGGYWDHITEVLDIAIKLYLSSEKEFGRTFPFSLSDAVLVLFLHDIEKPWKYEMRDGKLEIKEYLRDKNAQRAFRNLKLFEYGLALTDEQANALKYVEGEGADYSTEKRIMNELAGFCHVCDILSARVWHNFPEPDKRVRYTPPPQ
jgi:hypothetical protein